MLTFYLSLTEKLLVQPDPGLYSMINQGVLTVDGIDDVEEMKMTDEAFDILGFTPEEKLSLYKGMSDIFLDWNFTQPPPLCKVCLSPKFVKIPHLSVSTVPVM